MRWVVRFLMCAALVLGVWSCTSPQESCAGGCPQGQVCQSGQCVTTGGPDGGGGRDQSAGEGFVGQESPTPDQPTGKEQTPTEQPTGTKVVLWEKATTGSQADLYGVSMPTAQNAWAVGSGGTILVTSDGGATWKAQTSGVTVTLTSVSFINAKQGWAVGEKGTVLSTEDGGANWNVLTSPIVESLRRVQFFDDQNGVAVGDGFALLRTNNGGGTWQSVSSTLTIDLYALSFWDDRRQGVVVGSSGTILYTTDGGQQVTTVVTATQADFWAVALLKSRKAWAAGTGGTLLYSEDGGQGWQAQKSGVSGTLYGLGFVSDTRGWVVGAGGVLLGTRDGKAWRSEARGAAPDLHGISVFSERAGVIVGKQGTILALLEVEGECAPGQTRACYTGPAGTQDVGACKAGTQTCEGGVWKSCEGEVKPTGQEICFNGQDDNCNGKPDDQDGCAACQDNDTKSCYTGPTGTMGTGACRAGTQTCTGGKWGTCAQEVLPKDEDCNGTDDDCDGQVDEEPKNPPRCTLWNGVCGAVRQQCNNGSWVACTTAQYGADYEAQETKCDGKDNDCDGAIDETCSCTKDGDERTCYGGPFGTDGKGTCMAGKQVCRSGKWSQCEGQVRPRAEICADSKDNDCDGIVDEKSQYAAALDGRRAYLDAGAKAALALSTALTVEAWVYVSSVGGRTPQTIVSMSQEGGYGLYVDQPRGSLAFRIWPEKGTNYLSASFRYGNNLRARTWVHIAGTFDGTTVKVWLNGKMVGQRASSSKTIGYTKTNVPLLLGAEADEGGVARLGWYLGGRLGMVRISKTARYSADFKADCVLAKDADTVALWALDDRQGDTASDETGNFPAKLVNASWVTAARCAGYYASGCQNP